MIVFYAHTNASLFNMCNIKANFFPDEEADLVIYGAETTNESLVSTVKAAGLFREVRLFDNIAPNPAQLPFNTVPVLRSLIYYNRVQGYFDKFFARFAPEGGYDRLFVDFFSNNGFQLYIAAACEKLKKGVKISFVEEGTAHYYLDDNDLCTVMLDSSRKSWRVWKLRDGRHLKKMKSRVDSVYMYEPQYFKGRDSIRRFTLPKITPENEIAYGIMDSLSGGIDNVKVARYYRDDLIYFTSYSVNANAASANAKSNTLVSIILEKTRPAKDIIKVHTNNSAHAKKFAAEFESKVFVDRDVYFFESMLTQINLTNKILISNVSTACLTPKLMYGQEPYVIFVYKFFPDYMTYGADKVDVMVEEFKASYSDPSKVYIPDSISEFKLALSDAYSRVQEEDDELRYK